MYTSTAIALYTRTELPSGYKDRRVRGGVLCGIFVMYTAISLYTDTELLSGYKDRRVRGAWEGKQ